MTEVHSRNELFRRADAAIDRRREQLVSLSLSIHAHPETAYAEYFAVSELTRALADAGLAVQHPYCGLPTAFRAETLAPSAGPRIAVLLEYDALPELGHGCGHNLMAMIGLATALAVHEIMREAAGCFVALGTPAEESGGGKIALLDEGAFKDIDAALILHVFTQNELAPKSLAMDVVDIEFRGTASHAASAPELGRNALDAVILTFTSVNALRQQLRSDARIHGIVTNGGAAINVIPDRASARFGIRAADLEYEKDLLRRVQACAEAAAAATATQLSWSVAGHAAYANLVTSAAIAQRWGEHMATLGQGLAATPSRGMGSTDMGNVSQVVPAIHPYVAVAPLGTPIHSVQFKNIAATIEAHAAALTGARALARTAIDLLTDRDLLRVAKEEFKTRASQPLLRRPTS